MNPAITYRNGVAHCEALPLSRLAEQFGTPLYVYSLAALRANCREPLEAFSEYPTLVCFAVKANGNLSLLRAVFEQGLGADVVSVGEMERAVKAGVSPSKIVFSGVGKRRDEIARALELGILSLNVESEFELDHIADVAREAGKVAPISLRINPDVDAKTHPSIATGLHEAKFGITEEQAVELMKRLRREPSLLLTGLAAHVGSQIVENDPFRQTAERLAGLAAEASRQGHRLSHVDLGGGLGIRYVTEEPPTWEDYARTVLTVLRPTGLKVVLEPGRRIVATAGALVTRVIGMKPMPRKNFVIIDAAMNDLMRPALYEAFHGIHAVVERPRELTADVVGPVCETGDILGRDRSLPRVGSGDLLWIENAGAYGMSMASQYNTRPRPAEVLVDGDKAVLIRRRETLDDLWAHEATTARQP